MVRFISNIIVLICWRKTCVSRQQFLEVFARKVRGEKSRTISLSKDGEDAASNCSTTPTMAGDDPRSPSPAPASPSSNGSRTPTRSSQKTEKPKNRLAKTLTRAVWFARVIINAQKVKDGVEVKDTSAMTASALQLVLGFVWPLVKEGVQEELDLGEDAAWSDQAWSSHVRLAIADITVFSTDLFLNHKELVPDWFGNEAAFEENFSSESSIAGFFHDVWRHGMGGPRSEVAQVRTFFAHCAPKLQDSAENLQNMIQSCIIEIAESGYRATNMFAAPNFKSTSGDHVSAASAPLLPPHVRLNLGAAEVLAQELLVLAFSPQAAKAVSVLARRVLAGGDHCTGISAATALWEDHKAHNTTAGKSLPSTACLFGALETGVDLDAGVDVLHSGACLFGALEQTSALTDLVAAFLENSEEPPEGKSSPASEEPADTSPSPSATRTLTPPASPSAASDDSCTSAGLSSGTPSKGVLKLAQLLQPPFKKAALALAPKTPSRQSPLNGGLFSGLLREGGTTSTTGVAPFIPSGAKTVEHVARNNEGHVYNVAAAAPDENSRRQLERTAQELPPPSNVAKGEPIPHTDDWDTTNLRKKLLAEASPLRPPRGGGLSAAVSGISTATSTSSRRTEVVQPNNSEVHQGKSIDMIEEKIKKPRTPSPDAKNAPRGPETKTSPRTPSPGLRRSDVGSPETPAKEGATCAGEPESSRPPAARPEQAPAVLSGSGTTTTGPVAGTRGGAEDGAPAASSGIDELVWDMRKRYFFSELAGPKADGHWAEMLRRFFLSSWLPAVFGYVCENKKHWMEQIETDLLTYAVERYQKTLLRKLERAKRKPPILRPDIALEHMKLML